MATRIISGLIGAALALVILFFNQDFPWLINLVTAIISVLAIREVFAVSGTSKHYFLVIPSFIFVPILPLFEFSPLWELAFYLYTLIMFCSMLCQKSLKLKEVFTIYSMTILISYSFFKIVDLRNFGAQYGSFYVFLALTVAWMSDTGAYFCGKFLGKSKLCPEISPKKTFEGFLGGIFVCLFCIISIAFIFNNFIFAEKQYINYLLILLLGLSGSLISSLGDLCFSIIKRRFGVKDFGNLMPGHGGVLDRFDSVIFVVPYVYLFLKFIPIMS